MTSSGNARAWPKPASSFLHRCEPTFGRFVRERGIRPPAGWSCEASDRDVATPTRCTVPNASSNRTACCAGGELGGTPQLVYDGDVRPGLVQLHAVAASRTRGDPRSLTGIRRATDLSPRGACDRGLVMVRPSRHPRGSLLPSRPSMGRLPCKRHRDCLVALTAPPLAAARGNASRTCAVTRMRRARSVRVGRLLEGGRDLLGLTMGVATRMARPSTGMGHVRSRPSIRVRPRWDLVAGHRGSDDRVRPTSKHSTSDAGQQVGRGRSPFGQPVGGQCIRLRDALGNRHIRSRGESPRHRPHPSPRHDRAGGAVLGADRVQRWRWPTPVQRVDAVAGARLPESRSKSVLATHRTRAFDSLAA